MLDVAALVVSIFAALFAFGAAWAARHTVRHDQTQTGTRQPLIAHKGYRSIPFNQFDPDPRPADWDVEQMRWVPIHVINRAGYPVTLEGPLGVRRSWPFGWRSTEFAPSPVRTISKTSATWYFVRMRKPHMWMLGWTYIWVRWKSDDGTLRYHGWVRLRDGRTPTKPSS